MPAFRRQLHHRHVVDAGAGRAVPEGAFETVDRFALAFRFGLDAAVGQVAHPAGKAVERRPFGREKPEPYALHASRDREAPRRQQNRTIILLRPVMTLSSHSYGAAQVRLLRVVRRGDRHDVRDLTVGVTVEGEIGDAFTRGDNELLLPADTLRNTVNVTARDETLAEIEQLGIALARRFMSEQPQFSRVRIELAEQPWTRLPIGGRAQGRAFAAATSERRTASVTSNGTATAVNAGIRDFAILKTSGAAFEGYLADQFTTLEAEADRLLAVTADVTWSYLDGDVAFGPVFQGVRQLLVEAFVQQPSRSAEHTAHAMAEIVLETYADVGDVTVRLRQRALPLIDLSPFNLDNPHVLFRPEDAPELTAEVTVTR